MRKIYFVWLCWTAVLTAGCVSTVGLSQGGPEKSPFGYRIRVAGEKGSTRAQAEQQARAFCGNQSKRYRFGRLVRWTRTRMGADVHTYDFYFTCEDGSATETAEPEKLTPEKGSRASIHKEEPASKKVVPTGKKATEKTSGATAGPEGPAQPARKPATEAGSSEKQPATVSKEGGPQRRPSKITRVPAKASSSREKKYVPGEPEPLGPSSDEDEPVIFGGSIVEEPLEE